MSQTPPSIIAGKYEVLGRLGQGGQGSVWKVRHIELDQVRAIKWHPDAGFEDHDSVLRFRKEGLALARLRHAHIVQVFDLDRDADAYYLVMEYVEGQNLAQRLKTRGRPTLQDGLEIARQVASALAFAHGQPYVDSAGRRHKGMIHRDIKPSNILLRDQAEVYALLADFGLVKLGDAGERTTTGAVMGTHKYSAPEQLGLKRGRERVSQDFRADIFAFGLVLYELLEGRQFHAGLEVGEVLGRVLYEDLEPEFTQAVSPRLQALVASCMRRFPEDRPDSMAFVLREVEAALADLRGDETQTLQVELPGGEEEDDLDIDRRIEALLQKKERRRLEAAQAASQAARERAVQARAPVLVTAHFEQAVRGEEDASLAARRGNVEQARELYEKASRLFAGAEAEAEAVRLRQEQEEALRLVAEARARAQAEGAADLAAAELARAAAREGAARQSQERGEHEPAVRELRAAQAAYDEAAAVARATRLRREAKAAREKSERTRRSAEDAAAPAMVPPRFEEGCAAEGQAEAALAQGDFETAREGYERAAAAFARAASEAVRERDRGAALAAREEAERARRASQEAGAGELVPARDAEARDALREAERAREGGDFEGAAAAYRQATLSFTDAAAAAKAARERALEAARRRAAEARQGADAARAEAEASGAPEWAQDRFARARAAVERGTGEERQGSHDLAVRSFEAAAELFGAARDDAGAARASTAERGAEEARGGAGRAGAERLAAASHDEAERLAESGRAALAARRWEEARSAFEQAAARYAVATTEAVAARREAEKARRPAEEAQSAARAAGAERYARRLLERGTQALAAGDARLAAMDPSGAQARFTESADAFREAARTAAEVHAAEEEAKRRAAAEARAREQAEAEHATASAAREQAEAAGAERYAGELHASACGALAQGEEQLGARGFDAARAAFARAAEEFTRAARAAREARAREDEARRKTEEEEKARRHAEAERAAALAARDEAASAGAERHARERYGSASRAMDEGEQRVAAGGFDAAQAAFARAAQDFARARREATEAQSRDAEARQRAEEQAQAKQEAETERAGALARRDEAAAAGAERYVRERYASATRMMEEGERQLGKQGFAAARAAFAQASQDFARAAREATAARAREAEEVRRQAEEERRRAADEAAKQRAAEEAAAKRRAEAAARAREHAEQTRTRARAAREEAAKADAERYAPELWATADGVLRDGEQRLDQEDIGGAEAVLTKAAEDFERAARTATEARAREEEARRRTEAEAQARRSAEEARTVAVAARREAEDADAARRATKLFREGTSALAAGEKRLAAGDYEDAQRRLAAATTALGRAARTAGEARRREEETRRKAEAAERRRAEEDRTFIAARGDRTRVDDQTMVMPGPAPRESVPEAVEPRPPAARPSRRTLVGGLAATVVVVVGLYLALRPGTVGKTKPSPTPSPRELAWVETRPREPAPALREGESLDFEARVADAGRLEALAYAWYLDDTRRAAGPSWRYAPEVGTGGAEHEVKVVASAGARTLEHRWRVRVEAVNRPPVIAEPLQERTRLELRPGASAELRVAATDPDLRRGDALRYVWERNGIQVAAGPEPTLTVRDPKNGDEVRVTVVDTAGLSAGSRIWSLAVEPAAVAANRPPRITGQNPRGAQLMLAEGDSVEFSVRAADPDEGDRLAYAWLLDGKKVGTSNAWTLSAPAGQQAPLDLEVQVSDAAGLTARTQWRVEVSSPRPRITEYEPRTPEITVTPGADTSVSVRAASGRPGGRLRYEWNLDGRLLPRAAGDRLALPTELTAGRHTVEVVAVDERDLRSEPRRWSVVVERPPAAPGITDAEVRDWLARYRAAFESNDKGALLSLGVVHTGGDAEAAVKGWGPRTVTLRNETIERQGQFATISFNRVDRDLEGRRDVEYPARLVYRLEKGPSGIRAVRR